MSLTIVEGLTLDKKFRAAVKAGLLRNFNIETYLAHADDISPDGRVPTYVNHQYRTDISATLPSGRVIHFDSLESAEKWLTELQTVGPHDHLCSDKHGNAIKWGDTVKVETNSLSGLFRVTRGRNDELYFIDDSGMTEEQLTLLSHQVYSFYPSTLVVLDSELTVPRPALPIVTGIPVGDSGLPIHHAGE